MRGSSYDMLGLKGPRKLDPLHRHRLSCMVTIDSAGLGPGSARIRLFLINTMFWSGTSFASVSAARLAGRRLYIKERVKNSLLKKKNVHILMRTCTIELRIGARVVGILRISLFGPPGKVKSVIGV